MPTAKDVDLGPNLEPSQDIQPTTVQPEVQPPEGDFQLQLGLKAPVVIYRAPHVTTVSRRMPVLGVSIPGRSR